MCLGAAAVAMISEIRFVARSPTDGTGNLVAWWDQHRPPGSSHMALPALRQVGDPHQVLAMFADYVQRHDEAGDPLAAWARTVIA